MLNCKGVERGRVVPALPERWRCEVVKFGDGRVRVGRRSFRRRVGVAVRFVSLILLDKGEQ